jgi:hypothetical protein
MAVHCERRSLTSRLQKQEARLLDKVYACDRRVFAHSVAPEWSRRHTNAGLTGDPARSKDYRMKSLKIALRLGSF